MDTSTSGVDRGFLTNLRTGSVDRDDYPALAEHLLEGRTQLASETGYLMKFGDVSHRGLTPFDVASPHDVPAYPLARAALESLPAHVRANLERDGALHFFFMGWALPIALAGRLLYFRNLPCLREGRLGLTGRVDPTDLLPDGVVPSTISTWMVPVWNLAILLVGIGFFYQDQPWSAYLFGPGYTLLSVLWFYLLSQAFRLRRSLRHRSMSTPELGP